MQLAHARALREEFDAGSTVMPIYLRRLDAEINERTDVFLLGAILFGETVGPAILIAAALAAAGIVLINRPATPRR